MQPEDQVVPLPGAPAAASIRSGSISAAGWTRAARITAVATAAVVSWLLLLDLTKAPLVPQLEPSWMAAITYGAADGLQFGRDIIYTYGPLGHVVFSSYSERLFIADLLIRSSLVGYYVVLTFSISARLPLIRRILFVLAAVLVAVLSYQTLFVFSIASFGWIVSRSSPANNRLFLPAVMFAAAAGLVKLTFLLYVLYVLAAAVFCGVLTRKAFRPLCALLLCAAAFVIFWNLSGQHFSTLPDFVRTGIQVTTGYARTMNLRSSSGILAAGVATGLLATAQIFLLTLRSRREPVDWLMTFIFAAGLFLAWKLGFTRADAHTDEFFLYVIVLTLAAPIFFSLGRTTANTAADWTIVGISGLIAVAAVKSQSPGVAEHLISVLHDRWRATPAALIHWKQEQERYRASDERSSRAEALPRIKEEVGDSTVTVFGYEQAIALANRLNFIPIPTVQSYCAYTPALAEIDARFFRSRRAPEYVIFKLQSIDNRLASIDDADVLLQLVYGYEAQIAERGYVLLKRSAEASRPRPMDLPLRESGTVPLGKPFAVSGATWCELDFHQTLLGRMLAFLYQPPEVTADFVMTSGEIIRRRLLPSLTSTGFILNPLMRSETDFLRFSTGQDDAAATVKTVRINATGLKRLFARNIAYRLRTLPPPAPGSRAARDVVRDLAGYTDVFSRPAKLVWSSIPPERFVLDDRQFLLVHPMGEVRFDVPSGTRAVTGAFAIRPDAYPGTAGVRFEVVYASAGGTAAPLFARTLQPRDLAADRGVQRFRVELPLDGSGGELVLRTLPGPNGSIDWGWAGWSDIQFE